MINISVILCFMGALFGVFALIKWFFILKPDVHTDIYNVIPNRGKITIAWMSAAVTFYQTSTHDSPIVIQRFFMVLGRVMGLFGALRFIVSPRIKRMQSSKRSATQSII